MKTKLFRISTLVFFAVVIIFGLNVNVEAQHRRENNRRNDWDYREVMVRDRHYFYRDGYFYDRGPRGYLRVAAPIGARVTVLPHGYEIVRIRRENYYVFGGIYYRYLPRERVYVVIEMPR